MTINSRSLSPIGGEGRGEGAGFQRPEIGPRASRPQCGRDGRGPPSTRLTLPRLAARAPPSPPEGRRGLLAPVSVEWDGGLATAFSSPDSPAARGEGNGWGLGPPLSPCAVRVKGGAIGRERSHNPALSLMLRSPAICGESAARILVKVADRGNQRRSCRRCYELLPELRVLCHQHTPTMPLTTARSKPAPRSANTMRLRQF